MITVTELNSTRWVSMEGANKEGAWRIQCDFIIYCIIFKHCDWNMLNSWLLDVHWITWGSFIGDFGENAYRRQINATWSWISLCQTVHGTDYTDTSFLTAAWCLIPVRSVANRVHSAAVLQAVASAPQPGPLTSRGVWIFSHKEQSSMRRFTRKDYTGNNPKYLRFDRRVQCDSQSESDSLR